MINNKELNNDYSKIQAVSARFTGHVVTPNKLNVRLLKEKDNTFYFDVTTQQNKIVIKDSI